MSKAIATLVKNAAGWFICGASGLYLNDVALDTRDEAILSARELGVTLTNAFAPEYNAPDMVALRQLIADPDGYIYFDGQQGIVGYNCNADSCGWWDHEWFCHTEGACIGMPKLFLGGISKNSGYMTLSGRHIERLRELGVQVEAWDNVNI